MRLLMCVACHVNFGGSTLAQYVRTHRTSSAFSWGPGLQVVAAADDDNSSISVLAFDGRQNTSVQ
jgi:hypothetical protein